MEKVKAFYQKLYKRRVLNNNYDDFLANLPKVSDASKAAMEADLTLEELQDTNSLTPYTGGCGFFLQVKFATSLLASLAGDNTSELLN